MQNKANDLRDHLFCALERLNEEGLSEEQLKTEISRAQAIADVGKVLVDQAKTAILYAKITGRTKELQESEFIPESTPVKELKRPAAEYTNTGHESAMKKYGS